MDTKDWMSRLPRQCLTTELSVPGTHQSMSHHGGPTHRCQTMSLTQQYDAGIRFVDIHCRHYNDELLIYHNIVSQKVNFDDVLRATTLFLDEHRMEVIFMRVREEHKPENNTKSFAQAVQHYIDRYPAEVFHRGEGFPTIDEARGKLVILRDYDGPATFGLLYDDLDIEDQWHVSSLLPKDINKKWNATRSHLEKAKQGPADTVMYLTYSNGFSSLAFPDAVSERLNRHLFDFLRGKARWGLIAMDFPNTELIASIIDSNF